MDEALDRLRAAQDVEDLGSILRLLAHASTLLGDVARLSQHELDGLERVSVIVDGLCVTLEMDQRAATRVEKPDRLG